MSDRIMRESADEDERPTRQSRGGVIVDAVDDGPIEDDFEIVDTDSSLQPLEADEPEARLTEQEAADKPLIDAGGEGPEEQRTQRRNRAEERRRRKEGRERTFAENATLRAELANLRKEMEGIAPRLSQIDRNRIEDQVAATDRQMQEAATRAAQARRHMAEAITSADADAHTVALEAWENARSEGQRLAEQKAKLSAAISDAPRDNGREAGGYVEQPRREAQPERRTAPLPAAVMDFVEDFREKHPWLKTNANGQPADFDSNIMLQIDNAVASEGFDPQTQDYWDEIDERARQYLPHRFNNGARGRAAPARSAQPTQPAQQERPPVIRRGPMTPGSSERAPQPGSDRKVYLSPERKDALIAAGALGPDGRTVENKDMYTRYMRGFQKYDRENGNAGR